MIRFRSALFALTAAFAINQSVAKTLRIPELREKLAQQGVEAESSSPEQLAALLRQEMARWGKIIKTARIQPE